MPLRIPKSAGLSCAFGVVLEEKRLKPARASLTTLVPKVCVSFKVKICRKARLVLPKPGMVLPVRFGSLVSASLNGVDIHAACLVHSNCS